MAANNNGITAPPTIAVHNSPEACSVYFPKPRIDKVKIVGNINELKKPIANKDHIETIPEVDTDIAINMVANSLFFSLSSVFCVLSRENSGEFEKAKP